MFRFTGGAGPSLARIFQGLGAPVQYQQIIRINFRVCIGSTDIGVVGPVDAQHQDPLFIQPAFLGRFIRQPVPERFNSSL